jgi:uncharacterized membrane protein
MTAVVRLAAETLAGNSSWMAWNLLLALVPLALAVVLFLHPTRRTAVWWAGVATFIVFLPNAPYVLTDVIHLVAAARTTSSELVLTFVVLPQYALFFLVGFEAYVLSVLLVGRYLRGAGHRQWVLSAEVALGALCAVGIHLGRFERLNSWDLLARPELLVRGIAGMSLPLLAVAFVCVMVAYAVMKQLTLALLAHGPGRLAELRRR